MLKEKFISLVASYTDAEDLSLGLWIEIEKKYSAPKRHYYNLDHLNHLLIQLSRVQSNLNNPDAVWFALFYHDIVYNVLRSNNEEKSAALAEKRMQQLAVATQLADSCTNHILATKSHVVSNNSDTDYFTDADLSILGSDRDTYLDYCSKTRKEYSIYPDLIYNPGRKKVLTHFLQMERIYKTGFFYTELELQARQNLHMELEML